MSKIGWEVSLSWEINTRNLTGANRCEESVKEQKSSEIILMRVRPSNWDRQVQRLLLPRASGRQRLRVLIALARERVADLDGRDRCSKSEIEVRADSTWAWIAQMAESRRGMMRARILPQREMGHGLGGFGAEIAFVTMLPLMACMLVVMPGMRWVDVIKVNLALWRMKKCFQKRMCGECQYPCGDESEAGPRQCSECGASWPLVAFAAVPRTIQRRCDEVVE